MEQVNILITPDTKPNLNDLNQIKNGLTSINMDSSDSSSEYSSSILSSSSYESPKNKKYILVKKSSNNENNNKLESKIHYMKLDIVNKDIEIEEYKNKCIILNKYEQLFKNIEFLFERLNNAIVTLKERINVTPDNDLFKHIILLEHSHSLCLKTKEKYNQYLDYVE
jgi:hypothetical protein